MIVYMRIKIFLISVNQNFRYLSVIGVNLKTAPACKEIARRCQGIVGNGACPSDPTQPFTPNFVSGLSLADYFNVYASSNKEGMRLLFLTQSDISYLDQKNNKVGLGLAFHNRKAFTCYDDIIWAKNFYKNPYELYANLNTTGQIGLFYGFTVFYVNSYLYGGINSEHKCEVKNNYTKCIDSSRFSCADKYKSGENCQTDISICKTNPCKYGGKCHGLNSNYYCECKPGSHGKNCEKITCNSGCNNSICIDPNKCGECVPGFSGSDCNQISCENYKKCENGVCEIKNGSRVCSCSDYQFDGSLCQHECVPSCEHGLCSYNSGISSCVCIPGYYGVKCNRTTSTLYPIIIPKNLQFEKNVIIYAAIMLFLIIITFLFQIFYIKIKKNAMININPIIRKLRLQLNVSLSNINPAVLEDKYKHESVVNDDNNAGISKNVVLSELNVSSSAQECKIPPKNRDNKRKHEDEFSKSSPIDNSVHNNC